MYDLKSVKLTESEAQRHRLERSERKTTEKLDKLKSEKKTVEEELENVSRFGIELGFIHTFQTKVELSQQSKALEIELEQRQRRENEAIELGKKLDNAKVSWFVKVGFYNRLGRKTALRRIERITRQESDGERRSFGRSQNAG